MMGHRLSLRALCFARPEVVDSRKVLAAPRHDVHSVLNRFRILSYFVPTHFLAP